MSTHATKLKIKNQTILPLIMMILCFSILLNINGFPTFPTYSSIGQNISNPFSSNSSFQSKASILENMPSHNVTVGDIDIAYKQIGKPNAKPIILITGADATMDMWNPLLLEQLTSANYKVIFFEICLDLQIVRNALNLNNQKLFPIYL